MADVLVESRGGNELTWGSGADIVSPGEIRTKYIEAILKADAGNYEPLLQFAKS